ncbi:MAG: toll/interleukin-1 receptor domain-containing protein, partial [Acidobacteriota bacterium]
EKQENNHTIRNDETFWQKVVGLFKRTASMEQTQTNKTDITGAELLKESVSVLEQEANDKLRAVFETCIGLVESQDLIKRLSFGNLILLQPELLDAYASAIVNAAKDQPDGVGSIAEEDVLAGKFQIPPDERIPDKEQEKLLLIAMVEDLLRHEIALREQTEEGVQLVFPSQLRRERPDLPDPDGKAVSFTFEGPVLNIYATLVVRLSHSGRFKRKEMWKDAASYKAAFGGICGIVLRNLGEGQGELTLFFDEVTSKETRLHFENYVEAHLKRRALAETVVQKRALVCNGCRTIVSIQQIQARKERGFNWINCNVCETRISLTYGEEEALTSISAAVVQAMDQAADSKRDRDAAVITLPGKIATQDYDIYLCYNEEDKELVEEVREALKSYGILSWFAEREAQPGVPWPKALENDLDKIKAAAVFVGKSGTAPWESALQESMLRQFAEKSRPIIPVLLPDGKKPSKHPFYLSKVIWVDYSKPAPDPIEQLIWGITGKRDRSELSESIPTSTTPLRNPASALSDAERIKLITNLNALSGPLFNTLLTVIKPTAGVVSDTSPQATRVSQLINWAEGTGGCGITKIAETLEAVISPQ